jgi:hypothetical protein
MVHLFVRKSKKEQNHAAPFVYCGPVRFQSWEGNAPVSIVWGLGQPVPPNLMTAWKVEA